MNAYVKSRACAPRRKSAGNAARAGEEFNDAANGTQRGKAPLFGGRKPLFTQSQLLKLTWPLLVEQFLAVTVGMGRYHDGVPLRRSAFPASVWWT